MRCLHIFSTSQQSIAIPIENRKASLFVINSNQIFIWFDIFELLLLLLFSSEPRFIWRLFLAPVIPVTHKCCQFDVRKYGKVCQLGCAFFSLSHQQSANDPFRKSILTEWTEAIKCTQQNKARKIARSRKRNDIFLRSFV